MQSFNLYEYIEIYSIHCFSYHTLRNIPNPSLILHPKLVRQFNFPSVPSLKYDPRNEIRAPEYRV